MMSMRFDVRKTARMYLDGMGRRDALVDLCEGDTHPDRWGVLLGSGCGLMMSVLDCVPFRYCIDIDDLKVGTDPARVYRFVQFVTMSNLVHDGGVALAGWFSITPVEPVRAALLELQPAAVVYAGSCRLNVPGEVDSLSEFITRTRARFAACGDADAHERARVRAIMGARA